MGCSNSPPQKTEKKQKNFFRLKTKEIEKLRTEVSSKEEKLFLDAYQSAKSDADVEFRNFIFSQDIYFELLNILKTNENIETLKWSNILFQGSTDVLPQLYHILKGKKSLTRLELEYITNLGNKKGNALYRLSRELPNLSAVILKEIELEPEDAEFIGMLIAKSSENLTYFEVDNIYFMEKTDYLLDGLNQNNSIKELVLNRLGLTESNFDFLISSLVTNYCLTKLDVSHNPIGKGVESIKKYPLVHLTDLIMNSCNIKSNDFKLLCEGIESNKELKVIELNGNQIDNKPVSVKAIENFFKNNNTIQIFSIKNNMILREDVGKYLDEAVFERLLIDDGRE